MINASDKWKNLHKQKLLPETNVEVTCKLTTDPGYVNEINPLSGTSEADFSRITYITDDSMALDTFNQTLEHNLWVLDGNSAPEGSGAWGYVSEDDSAAGLYLGLSEIPTTATPGVTITWNVCDTEGYATRFSVTVKNGDVVLTTRTVEGNTSRVSIVDMEIEGYNRLEIEVLEWSLPTRRSRVYLVELGYVLAFDKKNLMSFTHEQQGHPNAGELTKNEIKFSFDNRDGIWDPLNPSGLSKFLSERQRVDVRYGLDVDGVTEWIDVGRFFLSSWEIPSNSLEARFSARDVFGFLQSEAEYSSSDTLYDAATKAMGMAASNGFVVPYSFDESLGNYPAFGVEQGVSCAELLQMCANATCCLLYYDRWGITIAPKLYQQLEYTIPASLSYSHPEIALSKPLKAVAVSYGDGLKCALEVENLGEVQTVDNPQIRSFEQAENVAKWVKNSLVSRKTAKGEFRADPRLELFDIVTVESKYGDIYPVMLTYIKYTYNGSFNAAYEGRVITEEV